MSFSLQAEIELDQYAELNRDKESEGAQGVTTSQNLKHFIP